MTIRIAVVGVGKIARDQHLPVIVASPDFALAALVSRHDPGLDAPWYPTLDALLASETPVDAIALCTPTAVRYDLAALAMQRGVHCLLEKPPAATLSEFDAMRAVAEECGTTLFASWHSRFAACVGQAQEWLAGRHIKSVAITWRSASSWSNSTGVPSVPPNQPGTGACSSSVRSVLFVETAPEKHRLSSGGATHSRRGAVGGAPVRCRS